MTETLTSFHNESGANFLHSRMACYITNVFVNRFTISDSLSFVDEIQNLEIGENDILVSYDVMFLFTNAPLQETIAIITEKVFVND